MRDADAAAADADDGFGDGHGHEPGTDGGQPPQPLPVDVRAAFRFFAFYLANGTVDVDLLEGFDYRARLWDDGSALEAVFAVFTNVLRVDEEGRAVNAGAAQDRAAQLVRRLCDPGYRVEPPFEPWETELHL